MKHGLYRHHICHTHFFIIYYLRRKKQEVMLGIPFAMPKFRAFSGDVRVGMDEGSTGELLKICTGILLFLLFG
jgi:hypothetical protein